MFYQHMELYDHTDYVAFLKEIIAQNREIRGYQGKLAAAAGMHPSYLSRVLKGHVDITPDQAAGVAHFLKLDVDREDYFLDLVNLARAATAALTTAIERRLQELRHSATERSKSLEGAITLSHQGREAYFSSWCFSAVHALLLVPGFQTAEAISRRLRLPLSRVATTLSVLRDLGLVQHRKERWIVTKQKIHFPKDPIWSSIHHASWRAKTASSLDSDGPETLHFSGTYTITANDMQKITRILHDALKHVHDVVDHSKDEDLAHLGIDFYRV